SRRIRRRLISYFTTANSSRLNTRGAPSWRSKPGASSMVPHIVLEEIGTPYQRQLVDLTRGEHKSDAYLKINPHGKVPALAVDDTVLTENVAILTYLAKRFPEAQLLPDGVIEQARCVSMMAWFASAVHTTFAHIIRPERFASDSATHVFSTRMLERAAASKVR